MRCPCVALSATVEPVQWAPRYVLLAAPEAHGQVVQATNDEASKVRQAAWVLELQTIQSCEQSLEADARLGAGKTGADTEVLAVTERDVAPCVRTLRVEAVGIFEHQGITVGGADHRHQDGARRDVDAGDLGVLQGHAEGPLDGALEAQTFLDEIGDCPGISA